jgi:hypothetical protein
MFTVVPGGIGCAALSAVAFEILVEGCATADIGQATEIRTAIKGNHANHLNRNFLSTFQTRET